jgi:hypothetical protein
MKARVEPGTRNQKSCNAHCCQPLSLGPVLENGKGLKRKGKPVYWRSSMSGFSVASPATAEQKRADMVVGPSEPALASPKPPHPRP